MTQTVSQAVAHRDPAPITLLHAHQQRFEAVLPDHIDARSFVGLAAGALYRDAKLMEAATNAPGAFANALMRCAQLGHQPGTEEYYLIPRKNKKNAGRLEIQGIEGYRGIIERMYRSGAVASVIVREVCAGDQFAFVEGEQDRPIHAIDWFNGEGRGEMIGVYAYAKLVTGAISRVVVLNKKDVMAAKAKSDAASSEYSPWNSREDGGRSMWWKTAARRLEPWVPTSAEYRREMLRAAAAVTASTRQPAAVTHQGSAVDTTTGEIADAELVGDDEGGPEEYDPTDEAGWTEQPS